LYVKLEESDKLLFYSKSNTMGVTSGAGTALPSGSPEFTFVICELRVVKSLVFCVTFVATIYFETYLFKN
jgi:hypothetical protein